MLEANARLGWRDVQAILAYSADHVGSAIGAGANGSEAFGWTLNKASNFNGGGLHFSNDYGFGRVDAFTAVRMAEVWSLFGKSATSKNEATATANGTVERSIADKRTLSFTFSVRDAIDLEHVDLSLTLSHADVSQLRVELISPKGTRSVLLSAGGEQQKVSNWTWTLGSEAFRGEISKGTWTVKITDVEAGANGRIKAFEFAAFGEKTSRDDIYHFTDEFWMLAATSAKRAAVSDKNGGTDWLSFAGLTQDLDINLTAGSSSTADGAKFITITRGSQIENIVAGDGHDVLRGNSVANKLYGMRGDDWLIGGKGRDLLNGGAGVDTGDYSSSAKAVTVDLKTGRGTGGDAAGDLLKSIENLVGSRWSDRLSGDAADNRLDGGPGNDILTGRGGRDTFVFSQRAFGRDTVSDFQPGEDHIDLSALGLDWSDLAISERAGGAFVACEAGEIWLPGVTAASLTRDDFWL